MKTLIYSLLFSLSLNLAWASKSEMRVEKRAQVKLEVAKDVDIEIDGSNTDMRIDIWDEPRIEIEAVFRYRGEDHQDKIAEFLSQFQEKIEVGISQSPGSVRIETFRSLPKKVQIGTKDFMIFEMAFSRDEVQLEYHIHMPAKGKVNIKHSYRDLRIYGDLENLQLYQYSGRLAMDNIKKAQLTLKYGEANVRRLKDSEINLYENDLIAEELGDVELNIKYSQLRSRFAKKLDVQAYESELEFEEVKSLDGNFKYSRFRSARLKHGVLVSYESRYDIQDMISLRLDNSKYSTYGINRVDEVRITQAYEDNMTIRSVKSMAAGNSKYCKHRLGSLEEDYSLDGYESDLQIDKLSGPKGDISIKGKYIKAEINTADAVFDLIAAMQYGNIDYRRAEASAQISEEGSRINAKIQSKARKEGAGYKILVDGYEMKVQLY